MDLQQTGAFQYLSESLQDLLGNIFTLDPAHRITTDAIAAHPWLAQVSIQPPAVAAAEAPVRDWGTFWPDAESLMGAAGGGAAGIGLPTVFSFGSDDSAESMCESRIIFI